jgi:replication factor C small subunit|tara:strand:+ start:70 stop:984 length:915 start_codon:yes stop_codon:yes gene_type:complete
VKDIWVEKYRPKTVDEYVFKDNAQKHQVKSWITDGGIPHLLFSGSAGTGKTTLAKVLINDLGVQEADVLLINASRDNGVDLIRRKITNFSETMPWGDYKVILLDEADYISAEGQAALRGVMEQYHMSVRFILTCNYPNKIIPALHSRCQGFHITSLDTTEFTARVAEILLENNVTFELDTLDSFVRATYPDLRKTINSVQMAVVDGELKPAEQSDVDTGWRIKMVELFKAGQIREARKLIIANCRADEYEEIYRWLYRNVEFFGDTEDKQDQAVVVIKNGIVTHTQVADVEINLSATLIELNNL